MKGGLRVDFFNVHKVQHPLKHSTNLRIVFECDRVMPPAEAQRLYDEALMLRLLNKPAALSNFKLCHDAEC